MIKSLTFGKNVLAPCTRVWSRTSKKFLRATISERKTSLIPKEREFLSENQRPTTCLNNMVKWFTSCLHAPMDQHLDYYDLMKGQQRGAKSKCFGTTDNLLVVEQ